MQDKKDNQHKRKSAENFRKARHLEVLMLGAELATYSKDREFFEGAYDVLIGVSIVPVDTKLALTMARRLIRKCRA